MTENRGLSPVLLLFFAVLAGCALQPPSPQAFAFGVMGDAPYNEREEAQFVAMMGRMSAEPLEFVVHVGDFKAGSEPCTDALFERRRAQFDASAHPFIYTPGDNEWADCWERGSGAFAPLERLDAIRRIFFADPARSLGATPMPLESQGGREPFGEFVENARWTYRDLVFVTVDMPGSRNARAPFPKRTPADDEASKRRTDAAAAWARATFERARSAAAPAVVIAFHANAGLEEPAADSYRQAFEPFLSALAEEAARFEGQVLIVHGDGHEYVVDHPLPLANVTRMQVPGSPRVGWVSVNVTPGLRPSFAFEEHVIPRWKYW